MTHAPPTSEELEIQTLSFHKQKESFQAAASQYFTLLSSIDINLRRQVHALEEVDFIPAEAASKGDQANQIPSAFAAAGNHPNAQGSRQFRRNKGAVTGGGLGSLDIGWLNSRNDSVGKEMEAELWEGAARFVETLEKPDANVGEDADLGSKDRESIHKSPEVVPIASQMDQ